MSGVLRSAMARRETLLRMSASLVWSRATLLSAFALLTGAAAHVQAGGLLPGPVVLVLLVASGACCAAPLLCRPGSVLRIVFMLIVGQAAVHMALAVAAGHRGERSSPLGDGATGAPASPSPPVATGGGRSGSYYDVAYAPHVGQHADGVSIPSPFAHAFNDVMAHPGMAVMHVLAAALCGWWLAMGERALWRLLELAARAWSDLVTRALRRWILAARALIEAASSVELAPYVAVIEGPRPQSHLCSRRVSRRGPPAP